MNANARELTANFDLEKLTPEFYADPYPTYRALREHEPVKLLPNGSWFLTRYDDLVGVYKNKNCSAPTRRRSLRRNTATPCFMSTIPPASSSTIRPRIPACGG
jgi:cytochrome P450